MAAEVARRYVAGVVDPRIVAPYLRNRLGIDAVVSYAKALLAGRPELWPAFLGQQGKGTFARGAAHPDHGTELAAMLAKHAPGVTLVAPADAIHSVDIRAANLRCFLGRMLRAWGEPEAAGLLRRLSDEGVKAVLAKAEAAAAGAPTVDDGLRAEVVLGELTGDRRRPTRETAMPRFFQYHELHGPFSEAPE